MTRILFNELPESLMPLMMKTENYIEKLGFDIKLAAAVFILNARGTGKQRIVVRLKPSNSNIQKLI